MNALKDEEAAQSQSAVLSNDFGASNASRSNALSNKINTILSASYIDLEIRDALETLDARRVRNTPETRRNLRLDVQNEIIQCNGEIVQDFGQVATVCKSRKWSNIR